MGTIRTEVKTFIIDLECDCCKGGVLEYTGRSFTNSKSYNMHICSHCKKEVEVIDKKYPITIYKKVKPKSYETGPR